MRLTKCLEPRLGAKSGVYRVGSPDFPHELLQQFLGSVMQEDETITQHAKVFASEDFAMAQWLFPFPEIEGMLIFRQCCYRCREQTQLAGT
ncbi:hypothetical protein AVEN_74188-1 [Araneus ventricosus]|uniref:Uncharacterized protein n=1 Tax=Araneus ventricosus TaxID=182803 RepID=A0A4Y2IBM6_ARAVE|nr:hypothetical protein AVEN_74188-1 [Araneus ventricosus]